MMDAVYRAESRRVLATLIRLLGRRHAEVRVPNGALKYHRHHENAIAKTMAGRVALDKGFAESLRSPTRDMSGAARFARSVSAQARRFSSRAGRAGPVPCAARSRTGRERV